MSSWAISSWLRFFHSSLTHSGASMFFFFLWLVTNRRNRALAASFSSSSKKGMKEGNDVSRSFFCLNHLLYKSQTSTLFWRNGKNNRSGSCRDFFGRTPCDLAAVSCSDSGSGLAGSGGCVGGTVVPTWLWECWGTFSESTRVVGSAGSPTGVGLGWAAITRTGVGTGLSWICSHCSSISASCEPYCKPPMCMQIE